MIDPKIEPVAPAVPEAVDYSLMYSEMREENTRLKAIMTAARIEGKPVHAPGADRKPAVSAEHVRRSLGPLAMHNMTRNQKLEALGLNPEAVSDGALKKLFGRGNDGVAAKDLHNADPLRLKQLREAALLLNVYGG
jgi:hypothetical protein